ncbi:hypothetical protein [Enterococcus faecalis]|nr:hypothetical protein [Enterococcus faecalis]
MKKIVFTFLFLGILVTATISNSTPVSATSFEDMICQIKLE